MIWRNFRRIGLLLVLFPALPGVCAEPDRSPGLGPVLAPLLEAEFRRQAGDYPGAARAWLAAAEVSDDPAVSARAAQAALAAADPALLARAVWRWQLLAPEAPAMLDARVLVALQQGDDVAATQALAQRLAEGVDGVRRVVRILSAGVPGARVQSVLAGLLDQQALPDDLDTWLALAALAQRAGGPMLADRFADAIVTHFAQAPRAWLLKAARMREHGDAQAAGVALERAAALRDHDDDSLRFLLAGEFAQQRRPAEAAAVLAAGEQSLRSLRLRASYLSAAEDDAGLRALYDQAQGPRADRREGEWLLLLGQLAEALKERADALAWYRAIAAGDTFAEAQLRIAVVLESNGDHAGALAHLRRTAADTTIDGESRRDAWLYLAQLLGEQQDATAEIATLSAALNVFVDDQALLYARALASERADRLDDAESDLRRILDLDPDNLSALNALGYTLADRTERFDEALALIERAYDREPDNPAFVDSLGWVLFRMGRIEEALPHLRQAAAAAPDPEVLAHLAQALWASGARDEARAALAKGQALDPGHRAVARAAALIGT